MKTSEVQFLCNFILSFHCWYSIAMAIECKISHINREDLSECLLSQRKRA